MVVLPTADAPLSSTTRPVIVGVNHVATAGQRTPSLAGQRGVRIWWMPVLPSAPRDSHEGNALQQWVEQRLRSQGNRAAMVIGSVARGTALRQSDLDVLAVDDEATPERSRFERVVHGERLVEVMTKTRAAWLDHIGGRRPRYVYSFLDGGEVLFDDGSLVELQRVAQERLDTFVTHPEVLSELATILWHSSTKLERAAGSQDPRTEAYWASVVLPDVLDAMLALHNRPCVPGSRRMDVLATITLEPEDDQLLGLACVGSPSERLAAVRALASSLARRLGPPDLERIEW